MENHFGNVSRLNMTAAFKDGKTILSDVYFTAPFKIMRPYYERRQMHVMLQTASAGIMAGDQQELSLFVKEGASLRFLSQSYEKIHRMEEGYARRKAEIFVEKNACLHYTPLPVIPFRDSDFRSTLRVELEDETSRFVLSEVLCCGRVAHGEQFLYRRFQNRVALYQKGKIVYLDNSCYCPGEMEMTGFGMYEGFTHLGNLLICNEGVSDEWMAKARRLMEETPGVEGGATRTEAGHVAVRILGMSGQKVTELQERLLGL